MYFFTKMKAEPMLRGYVVLSGWAVAFALLKKDLMELHAPPKLPTESHLELFCFGQSSFSGAVGLHMEEKRTFWILIVNALNVTVDKCSIHGGFAWYDSATRMLRDNLVEDGTCM